MTVARAINSIKFIKKAAAVAVAGLDDVGLGDVGLGDVGLGDVGLGDVGLGDVGLGDVVVPVLLLASSSASLAPSRY